MPSAHPPPPRAPNTPPPLGDVARLFLRYFLQGCLVVAPIVVTLYVVFLIFKAIDTLVPMGVPVVGFVLCVALVTGIGAFASSVFGEAIVGEVERYVQRVPLIRLLYGSIKDVLNAMVGDHKSFQSPVMVAIDPERGINVLGFMTREDVPFAQSHVAVYLPQSYNFAGNLILIEKDRLTHLDVNSADLMAFIVSGGVASTHSEIGKHSTSRHSDDSVANASHPSKTE